MYKKNNSFEFREERTQHLTGLGSLRKIVTQAPLNYIVNLRLAWATM